MYENPTFFMETMFVFSSFRAS